jgi:8-oxo-dGTP diphosphatase
MRMSLGSWTIFGEERGVFCPACGSPLPSLPPVCCAACGEHLWLDPKACAGAAVRQGTSLLMVRRAHEPWLGYWDVPGGFCEPGEHPIDTAERELLEETGFHVRITGFLGMWPDRYEMTGAAPKLTLNIYYHAELAGDAAAALDPHETAEVCWFPAEALPTQLAFPGHLNPMLHAWRAALAVGDLATSLRDRPHG